MELEVERRVAQPVCQEKKQHPIESTMKTLEVCGLLYGNHNGVAWEMDEEHLKRVSALPHNKAVRYAKAHRRWITTREMVRKGHVEAPGEKWRSLPKILEESRMFPNER